MFKSKLENKLEQKRNTAGIGYLKVGKAVWDFSVDGGAVGTITPKQTTFIPDNSVITYCLINSTTATAGNSGCLMSVGIGASTAILLAATASATLSADAKVNGIPTQASPVKTTAAGNLNFTITATAFTAGRVEATVYYTVAGA